MEIKMDLKFIKLFESFHKDYFDKLIEDDKTYIDKNEFYGKKDDNILNVDKYKDVVSKIRKYDTAWL